MLIPQLGGQRLVAVARNDAAINHEGIYADVGIGIDGLARLYDFIERHAAVLLLDRNQFDQARERVLYRLAGAAGKHWIYLDLWDAIDEADALE